MLITLSTYANLPCPVIAHRSPGILYILQVRSPGRQWDIGQTWGIRLYLNRTHPGGLFTIQHKALPQPAIPIGPISGSSPSLPIKPVPKRPAPQSPCQHPVPHSVIVAKSSSRTIPPRLLFCPPYPLYIVFLTPRTPPEVEIAGFVLAPNLHTTWGLGPSYLQISLPTPPLNPLLVA